MKNTMILTRKNLSLFLPVLLAFVLLSGCVKDTTGNGSVEPGYVMLNTDVSTFAAAPDNPNVRGAAEYVIRRVRLYAFDGDKLDNMMYVDAPPSGASGTTSVRMKVKQTTDKTLYVIVNEPDDPAIQSRLALINNPAAFAELEYAMAAYFTDLQKAFNADAAAFEADKFCLPMSGQKSSINTVSNADVPVSLPVTRSLARVDVMLQKNTDVTADIAIKSTTTVDILNTRAGGFLFGDRLASEATGELNDVTSAASGPEAGQIVPVRNADNNTAAVRAFSFYTPERDCTAKKLGLKLNGVDFGGDSRDYQVEIGSQDGNKLTKIERNKVHRIYCTFKKTDTNVEIQIKEWDDVSVTGDIVSGSALTVSRIRVLMDYASQNNSFTTQVNYASDGNVSFVGYVTKDSGGTEVVTTDGSNLPTWLPKANITGLPDGTTKTGAIALTYVAIDGQHPDVALRLKTGNIVKDIDIVYDNGLIPASALQAVGWTTGLPTVGLQCAKRGNILPTGVADADWTKEVMQWATVTTSVLAAQQEGYGYGAANTTAIIAALNAGATAANTCRSLGAEWYLSSKDELMALYNTKNYLGASYPFYYYYYWSSTEEKNSYSLNSWRVSLDSGYTHGNSKTRTNYVRCVRDF